MDSDGLIGNLSADWSLELRKRYRCPCCGYPTLGSRRRYDVCVLCGWEDDGQDDPCADEVRGGPNGYYSLTQARDNFRDHFSQYDMDDPRSEPYGEREIEAKRALIATFMALQDTPDFEQIIRQWDRVRSAEQMLRYERRKGIRDKKWSNEQSKKQWTFWERIYGAEWVRERKRQISLHTESKRQMRIELRRLRYPRAAT